MRPGLSIDSDQASRSESPGSATPEGAAPSPLDPSPSGASQQRPPLHQPQGYANLPRRTHKKSRTGCATCKSRKIKCDERHPACLNCIAHGVECPFMKGNPPAAAARNEPRRARLLPRGGELPLLELELLHNYTTKTYSTLTAAPIWEFWRDDVVQLGLTCDYIMRTVLAVSALHLAYHRPDRRDYYIEEGILLHQQAARAAMEVMAAGHQIDPDEAGTLFVFSMLTMFFALASPRRSNPDGTFFIGQSGFPDWAFLLSGGKSIMAVLGDERGLKTVAAPFLAYGHGRWHAQQALLKRKGIVLPSQQTYPSPDTGSPGSSGTGGMTPPAGQGRAEPLLGPLRARITAAVTDPSLLATYTFALDELEMVLAVSRDPDADAPRDVLDAMVWLWRVSDTLVPLLRVPAQAQEAVAIFAHFCVLLKHHETAWWLQGWGDAMLLRAREVLDEEHQSWIEWPVRELARMRGEQ